MPKLSEHYLDVKFENENKADAPADEKHFFESLARAVMTMITVMTTHYHLSSSIEKPENKQPKQQQQRKQTVISGQKKVESCGKQLQGGNRKCHLKSHAKLKPHGCTYKQCSYETEHCHDALRHIKSVHLAKKKKMNENDENENPVVYLSLTMFSVSKLLALKDGTSVVNSMMDSFFEEKKLLVTERLMESVKVIVDGLFDEMVGQVKEMLLPPKEGASNDQVKPFGFGKTTSTLVKPPTTKSPMKTQTVSPSHPPKSKMIFATKSKPGPSTSAAAQPFSGLYKRMAEEDGVGTSSSNSQPNKKKAVTEDDVAFSTSELLVVIPIEQALMENGMDSSTFGAGGGDAELINNIDIANIHLPNTSKEQHQQRPTHSGKHPCTEPDCGKYFQFNADLKRHLRTHTNAKPFGCTYSGCSLEFSYRSSAIRHILNVHLKKEKKERRKPGEDAEEEDGNDDKPADPAAYLSYFSPSYHMFSLGSNCPRTILPNEALVWWHSFFEGKKAW
ncbi:hypothetical protein TYRP_020193 [Tyrophagus putrescentiae]|nr:hypothetical protein TYRP_020193 [Tyrophagus putrescentiae]